MTIRQIVNVLVHTISSLGVTSSEDGRIYILLSFPCRLAPSVPSTWVLLLLYGRIPLWKTGKNSS
jgi:hypothetical protein